MHATAPVLPPISHTGVEPSQVTLGWWAGTRQVWDGESDQSLAWAVFSGLGDIVPGGSNLNSRSQWYQRSFARDDAAATVYYGGIGDARGTVMLSIRQSWFEQGPEDPVDALRLLLANWRTSRVDLAADVTHPDRLTPATLYDRLPAARSRSRPANRVLTCDWSGGQKLTLGSRSSDRYVRVYAKGERVRHEIELKRAPATEAWSALLAGASPRAVWAEQYGRVVEWR